MSEIINAIKWLVGLAHPENLRALVNLGGPAWVGYVVLSAIVLARFVPLVRTFTPFVAGVARMSYRRYVVYNIVGGVGWVVSMTLAGYFLGQMEWIQKNFELVVIGIVVVSVLPILSGVAKH